MTTTLPHDTAAQHLNQEARALIGHNTDAALDMAREAYVIALETNSEHWQGESLWMLGQCSHRRSKFEEAIGYFERAIDLLQRAGVAESQAACLVHLARTCIKLGEMDLARGHLKHALHLCQQGHFEQLEADALNNLAHIENLVGRKERALEHLERSLELRGDIGDTLGLIAGINNVAIIYTQSGQYQQALEYLNRMYDLIQETDAREHEFNCLIGIANIFDALEQHEDAHTYLERALGVALERNETEKEVIAKVNLGAVQQRLGQHQRAVNVLHEARRLSETCGLVRFQGAALIGLGKSLLELGRPADALPGLQEALELGRQLGDVEVQLEALMPLARVQEHLGEPEAACITYEAMLGLAQRSDAPQHMATAHQRLAELRKPSDLPKAFEHLSAFARIREDFFEQRDRRMRELQVRLETDAIARANTELEQKVQERTRELEEAYVEMLTRLARAAEYRDDDTGQHTERVGHLSARIARALGWSEDQVWMLERAATLHDIGKIGIPDAVLLKPGRFTPEEFQQMKGHTMVGASILAGASAPLIQMAEVIAASHHERWDGTGYPNALSGEAIPLEGRIVSVADVFDALTSERPYKRAWAREDAIAEIACQAGVQFDPQVVAAFVRII